MDNSTKIVTEYILDTEYDDFTENPAKDHVYYHAAVVSMGQVYADKILIDALTDLVEGDKDE